MSRLKPYYKLLNSVLIVGDEACVRCGSCDRVRDAWIEDGHGQVPDDYRYFTHCVCDGDGVDGVEE